MHSGFTPKRQRDDEVYLHTAYDSEGRLAVFDQHGRRVRGLREITVTASYAPNDVRFFTAEIIERDRSGEPLMRITG